MSYSIRNLLIVFLYTCFALAALGNIDYPFFATVVKCVVIGTVLASVYQCWAGQGQSRAFHVGFAASAVLYLSIVALVAHQQRLNGSWYVFRSLRELLLPLEIAYIPWVADTFERAAHYLASLAVGLLGGSAGVFFYHKRDVNVPRFGVL
jgi:hypothetical protein